MLGKRGIELEKNLKKKAVTAFLNFILIVLYGHHFR